MALMDYLNEKGKHTCLYFNVEIAQAARENVKQGMKAILSELANDAWYFLNDSFLKDSYTDILEKSGEFAALETAMTLWSKQNRKPVIIFIDEVDSLIGDTLISLLRQLRSGYLKRTRGLFPQSIILCGVRDIRDYRIHSSAEKTIITGGSAFNIKAESLRLGDFSRKETEELYLCHTQETGQAFDPKATEAVWNLTEGQPWLVNALGYEMCFKTIEDAESTELR